MTVCYFKGACLPPHTLRTSMPDVPGHVLLLAESRLTYLSFGSPNFENNELLDCSMGPCIKTLD